MKVPEFWLYLFGLNSPGIGHVYNDPRLQVYSQRLVAFNIFINDRIEGLKSNLLELDQHFLWLVSIKLEIPVIFWSVLKNPALHACIIVVWHPGALGSAVFGNYRLQFVSEHYRVILISSVHGISQLCVVDRSRIRVGFCWGGDVGNRFDCWVYVLGVLVGEFRVS